MAESTKESTTNEETRTKRRPGFAKVESGVKDLDGVRVRVLNRQMRGFVDFLREQSVVGLAIGLILGTQAKQLVDTMIASFINPLVGLLLPGTGALDKKVFAITLNGKTADFAWGAFAVSLLTFMIVAAVVFYVFKGLKLDKLDKKKE